MEGYAKKVLLRAPKMLCFLFSIARLLYTFLKVKCIILEILAAKNGTAFLIQADFHWLAK